MREAGKVCGWILRELANIIQPGISTLEIDRFVEKTVREHGMRAAEKGYCGYPASVCVSVNDEVVHGIPSKKRHLREGDIVSCDLVVEYDGYMADAARTYAVGKISPEAKHLIETAERAFWNGIAYAKEGYRLSDISHRRLRCHSRLCGTWNRQRNARRPANSNCRESRQGTKTPTRHDACCRAHDYTGFLGDRCAHRRLDCGNRRRRSGGTLRKHSRDYRR